MIAVWIALAFYMTSATAVEVSTSLGDIRGVVLKSRLGEDFYAFRGIRYANPPVGELRFKNPQPVSPWKPNVFDATDDGPMCPQYPFNTSDYSEDCLRLNVYSKNLQRNASKPVIIYIHPGGFYAYSGQSKIFAGPQFLMDRDIVLVTINYRLGTLGFLAADTADAPGNAGLKDQVLAFKWVRDHIRSFGGDSGSVTLLGYSAGSLSIGLHIMSPMSKGLFHRGIAMSAPPIKYYPYSTEQVELAKKQARLVKCPTDDIGKMMKCLREVPAEEFVRTHKDMFIFGWTPLLNWEPIVEKDFGQERFLIEDPNEALKAGRIHKIPLIIGMTKDEFAQIAYNFLQNETETRQLNENWENLAPLCFLYERGTERSKQISAGLRKEYLDNKPLVAKGPFEKFGQIFSDGHRFAINVFAHLAAKYVPVHYYQFSYVGRFSHFILTSTKKPYGAVHHDDLAYLLYLSYLSPIYSKSDPEDTTVERMTRMWTQFAKTGDPNNSSDSYLNNLRWDPLDVKRDNYLDIGTELIMKEGFENDRFAIWKRLFSIDYLD